MFYILQRCCLMLPPSRNLIHADLLMVIFVCVFIIGTCSPPSLDSYLNNFAIIKE